MEIECTSKIVRDMNMECSFCNGTGIAVFVDMAKLPEGLYEANEEFYRKYGEYGACPNGCRIMN